MKKGVLSADAIGSAPFPIALAGVQKLATEWVASVSPKSTAGNVVTSVQASASALKQQEQKRKAAEKAAEEEAKKLSDATV